MRHIKTYLGEVISRAVKTVVVEAFTRKEALQKIRNGECEGIDVHYDLRGFRVVCRENYRKQPKNRRAKSDELF